jgi:hypothetical protein
MVMMTSASAMPSSSTASKGSPTSSATSARPGSISGCRFQPMTFSKLMRLQAAARSWNFAWWPAPTMPSTFASFRARCLIDTDEAAAVRSAVR